jgi:GT2 family glycosyltransferase
VRFTGIGATAHDDSLRSVDEGELPAVDLVVATVGRTHELERLLASLETQTHRDFRVLVVDQNEDDRLGPVLLRRSGLRTQRLRSPPRGLAHARNAALEQLAADLVTFPDDDCTYPQDLLERVATRFVRHPELDGLTGRTGDADGRFAPNWSRDPGLVTRKTVWHRANSTSMFLRSELVRRVGFFDESLGLGSGTPRSSSEEIDYLIRAIGVGARLEYDPSFVVRHALRSPAGERARARANGLSVGYLLRKHGYPARFVARMLARPLGGAAVSLLHGDRARASFYAESMRGRVEGYRGASREPS